MMRPPPCPPWAKKCGGGRAPLPPGSKAYAYLVKNTAGARKEPSKKYKNNLRARATSNAKLNMSIKIIKHLIFLTARQFKKMIGAVFFFLYLRVFLYLHSFCETAKFR